MNAILSNEFDTQTNRIINFDSLSTTPWFTLGTDTSTYAHRGLAVTDFAAYPQGNVKSWVDRVAFYETDDETGAFELIPSVQKMGYYGSRKIEKRPSAPTAPPVVHVKPAAEPCKVATTEPFKSVLMYLTEVGKRIATGSRLHKEMTADAVNRVLALVGNLTVRPGIHKDKWDARLDDLHTFQHGWDSYGAESPSEQSIGNARDFMAFLRTSAKEPTALNPSSVGGVGFTFRHGQRSVYIEFRNTGNAHAAFMGAGKPRVAKVNQNTDGFRAVMHQAETHLNEQDAAAARSDEAS